ncbi:MAG: HlyD family secretion protein [Gemmatimonadota bacterium]
MRKLFRQEAIDAQREKLLGEVSVARPVPLWVFTLLAATFATALVAFAFLGEYTRRERVEGFLALTAGAARIQAPEIGTVTELMVKEGDEVQAGAPIARLSLERSIGSGVSSGELVQRELSQRAVNLDSERDRVRQLADQQREQIRTRITDLRKEIAQNDVEIRLQQTRVASAREDFQRTQQLVKEGFVSDTALTQKRNDQLDQQVKLETLKRSRAGLERELRAAETELPTIDTRASQQIDQLSRQKSELQQSMVQEEAKRETIIRAPITGVVTNIAVARGASVAADAPIAMLLPKGSGLQAQLLVPTRAIGFVQPGNEVVLRYEAFPFQRFGQYRGTVEAISRTVWSTGEQVGSMTAKEPVYRIDVKLDRQTVSAGNQEFALRPGMLVNADILLERRTIFEWVFEPVLQLRERLR